MAFEVKFDNNEELIVYPIGELDVFTTPDLKKQVLNEYKKDKKNIIIDGTELEYVDSTGLGAFIYLLNEVKKEDHKISIKNMKSSINKLFVITKLDQIFEMRSDK